MKTVVLTVVVNDEDAINEAAVTDALGDVTRELERDGRIKGFRFGGTEPASHVVGPDDARIPVT